MLEISKIVHFTHLVSICCVGLVLECQVLLLLCIGHVAAVVNLTG